MPSIGREAGSGVTRVGEYREELDVNTGFL